VAQHPQSASSQLQASGHDAPRPGTPTLPDSLNANRNAPPPQQTMQKETTIRIDTARLDQVLNLSGEIGLTKNRIANLKSQIIHGKTDPDTLKTLDLAVNQLDLLVSDLQNAVMKTRMQPIGRLFQKYPRLARDLARQLGKDVELVLSGEETELDKTMIEDLNDPLVHLVRNAVDHGIETAEERKAANKSPKALVTLSASQVGDHIIIEISDDGRGIRPELIRRKALEKGLIDAEAANGLDDRQSLHLLFMPGFQHQGSDFQYLRSWRRHGCGENQHQQAQRQAGYRIGPRPGHDHHDFPALDPRDPPGTGGAPEQPVVRRAVVDGPRDHPDPPERGADGIQPGHHGGSRGNPADPFAGHPDRLGEPRGTALWRPFCMLPNTPSSWPSTVSSGATMSSSSRSPTSGRRGFRAPHSPAMAPSSWFWTWRNCWPTSRPIPP
jgi:hypothetical protein